jgi:hypothetical protein
MRRLLALTVLLAAASFSSTAAARSPAGASLSFAHVGPRHTFTLQATGFPLDDLHCFWASVHVGGCEGVWTGTVLTGGQPETYVMVDYVTREGPCSTPVTRRTGQHSGVAHGGGGRPRNCFVGPLVAAPGQTRLRG